ncbi:hypothetical protein Sme01_17610 [Sphaerisporangium melleum]|uniref:DUF4439 domain-containing protein n=1 Tax=Sphaerisporangium melleum TaxID=321316 RepID=A0A917R258_9ACTN|nr:ferritin-like domain-containing protein [Sphaerisporangium melleum]GGK83529.1 hypothetical protein GCM10007964_27550 [Sphaerisporangium melleum]GII69285.1 hypothetical protein Sme01_17610 [Sphaerisporangium melleum]
MTDAARELNKVLDAEHAAVYAYGVIGARLSGGRRSFARAGFDAHRARRDQIRGLVIARGGTPSEPMAAYQLPFPVATAGDAARLAALIEDRVTAAYLELTAVPDSALRRLAALAMQESTVRGFGWQPVIPALPGHPRPAPAASPTATASGTPPVSLPQ